MKFIIQYCPYLMFGLFVILSSVTAAKAIPTLFIPLLTALVVVVAVVLMQRLGK